MTFRRAFKESILEWMFGAHNLAAWREEKKRRHECERVLQAQYDEYRRLVN